MKDKLNAPITSSRTYNNVCSMKDKLIVGFKNSYSFILKSSIKNWLAQILLLDGASFLGIGNSSQEEIYCMASYHFLW